jgi:membrane protease YdiL (CAAX protease family)
MLFALLLSLLLVTYNAVMNRWSAFQRNAYVPINLAFTAGVTLVAAVALELTSGELGLRGDLADIGVAVAVVGVFGLAVFALARSRYGHRIADRRVQGLRGRDLAFYVLIRIPIGTAVAEELLFRAVLFASWRSAGFSNLAAASYSSIAFGLWHIGPTINGVRINDPDASQNKMTLVVVGAVLATSFAGLLLVWLRLETAGLVAPILVHAGVNSVAALAAVAASRRPTERSAESSRL